MLKLLSLISLFLFAVQRLRLVQGCRKSGESKRVWKTMRVEERIEGKIVTEVFDNTD